MKSFEAVSKAQSPKSDMNPIVNRFSAGRNGIKQSLTKRSSLARAITLMMIGAAVGLWLTRTEAANYTFDLHGSVDSGFTETYGGTPYLYELWQDPLLNMRQYYARAGDVLDVTVTLDRGHTIPASPPGTLVFVDAYFYGYSYPDVYGSSSTTASFFSQGALVFSTTDPTSSSSSGGTLANNVVLSLPNNAALTFDKVQFHSVVTGPQGSILNLSLAELSVTRMMPVPEPSVASLIVLGLCGVGLKEARRRK